MMLEQSNPRDKNIKLFLKLASFHGPTSVYYISIYSLLPVDKVTTIVRNVVYLEYYILIRE